jgi:uncharacterized protein (TIGR02594 family)
MGLVTKKAAVIAGCVVLALTASEGSAKPRKRHATVEQLQSTTPTGGMDNDGRYVPGAAAVAAEASAPRSRHGRPLELGYAKQAAASNDLIAEARRYLGGNPTGRGSLWCGAFLDLVLKRTGHKGGGNLARGYARYGTKVDGPQVGAIAVMTRNGGGHVGIVTGVDASGNPVVISGNHNNRVEEAVYPRSRVITYVVPSN